jgi:hypothetical protein
MPKSTLLALPLDELRHPDARWLAAYSASKVLNGEPLNSAAIEPHETRSMNPHLMVLEPTEVSDQLRYSSVGQAITSRFGIDLSGRTLCLASSGGWAPAMRQAIDERRPIALRGEVPGGQSSWAKIEALILPVICAKTGSMGVMAGLFFLQG